MTGKIRRVQEEIASKAVSLKEYEGKQLEKNHDEFKLMDEYKALDDEQKTRVDEIFNNAAIELNDTQSAYEIKGFAAAFIERNASLLLSLLNPPKIASDLEAEDSIKPKAETPQSVPVSEVCRRVAGPPFIKSEDEVDSYLDSLKALLLDEIRSGRVVVK